MDPKERFLPMAAHGEVLEESGAELAAGLVHQFQFRKAEGNQFIPVAPLEEDSGMVVGNPLYLSFKEVVGIVGIDDPHGHARVDGGKFLKKGGSCSHGGCLRFLAGG